MRRKATTMVVRKRRGLGGKSLECLSEKGGCLRRSTHTRQFTRRMREVVRLKGMGSGRRGSSVVAMVA
jgi:hypothetical protein